MTPKAFHARAATVERHLPTLDPGCDHKTSRAMGLAFYDDVTKLVYGVTKRCRICGGHQLWPVRPSKYTVGRDPIERPDTEMLRIRCDVTGVYYMVETIPDPPARSYRYLIHPWSKRLGRQRANEAAWKATALPDWLADSEELKAVLVRQDARGFLFEAPIEGGA